MVRQRVAGILSICILLATVSCLHPKPKPVTTTMKVSEMGLESHPVRVGDVLKWVADSPNISSFTIHVTGLNICKDQPEYIYSTARTRTQVPTAVCQVVKAPAPSDTYWYDMIVCTNANNPPDEKCQPPDREKFLDHTNPCGSCDGFSSGGDLPNSVVTTPKGPSPTVSPAAAQRQDRLVATGAEHREPVKCDGTNVTIPDEAIKLGSTPTSVFWFANPPYTVYVDFGSSSPCDAPLTPGRTVSCYVTAAPSNPNYTYTLTLKNGDSVSCTRSALNVSR